MAVNNFINGNHNNASKIISMQHYFEDQSCPNKMRNQYIRKFSFYDTIKITFSISIYKICVSKS